MSDIKGFRGIPSDQETRWSDQDVEAIERDNDGVVACRCAGVNGVSAYLLTFTTNDEQPQPINGVTWIELPVAQPEPMGKGLVSAVIPESVEVTG